jgi:hypothetical protein|tara:strand:+ start:229 stop:675 length:447 start_codon:yes stop_codon:yes gene_type:complete
MALVINKVYNAKDANGKTITSEYALHGMKRDDDGLLTYTKVNWYSADTIKMDNGEGTAYNSVGSFQTNEMEYASGPYGVGHNINDIPIEYDSTTDPRLANTKFRNYEQHVFDENKATYFINDEGYLILRIGSEYTYSSKDGATGNWTT